MNVSIAGSRSIILPPRQIGEGHSIRVMFLTISLKRTILLNSFPTTRRRMMSRQSQLTQQQEDFCNIYVRYPNATRAAVAVGYSHASARNKGYRLLLAEAVLARLADLRADLVRHPPPVPDTL